MTDQQELFLECLFGEARGNASEAKRLAGYADTVSASSILSSKNIQQEIERRTRRLISSNAPKAVFTMLGILDGDSSMLGKKEAMAAAKDFLDRGGFVKTDKIEVESKSPLFILPKKEESDAD